jgi:hypothetical protein
MRRWVKKKTWEKKMKTTDHRPGGESSNWRLTGAVVVDGKVADRCAGRGPDEAALRAAGIGSPIS